MALSARLRALLKKLLYAHSPLRIKELAEEFRVSERTVKYDLETIRMWLHEQRMVMQSKPNKGIWIECDDAARIRVLEKLEETDENGFSKQPERVNRLLLDLLLLDSPVPIGELAKQNDVTRNTIVSDLYVVEQFLKERGMQLERGRFGVKLAASEKKRRLALERLVLNLLDKDDTFQIVQEVLHKGTHYIPFDKTVRRFIDQVPRLDLAFQTIGRLFRELEKERQIVLSDCAITGILIRLCIVFHRHHQSDAASVQVPEHVWTDKNRGLYLVFQKEVSALAEAWGFDVSEQDVRFVCLQAAGAMFSAADGENPAEDRWPDAYRITRQLIDRISQRVQIDFRDDADLFNHLFADISDKIKQFRYGVVEGNPLLQEILRSYKWMFDHAKQACAEVLGPYGIELPDGDIASIVLHFQSAYERKDEQWEFQALVVCGTGRGLSKLVKTVIENEIKNVRVAAYCSVVEFEKAANARRFDLVISMFPIKTDIPLVVINSIPGKKDFQAIRTQLDRIMKARVPQARTLASRKPRGSAYGQDVLEQQFRTLILKGFDLKRALVARFGRHMSEERAEGLLLHLLFMMNRVAFGSQFALDEGVAQERVSDSEMGKELTDILRAHQIDLTESELRAILRYFK